jgi:hypothetical protein
MASGPPDKMRGELRVAFVVRCPGPDIERAIRVQNGDDIKEIATGLMEPNGQLVLTLKQEEQNASKGDIAAISTQLKAIQASLELLAAAR